MVDTVKIEPTNTGPTLEEQSAAQDAAAKAAESDPKLAGEDAGERPEWLPEKFKSVEDMAKAYTELEKTQGAPKEAPTAEAATEEANKAVEAAGLDMDALSAEFAEKGELTPESLESLAKVGITPEMVDAYVAGQDAQATAVRDSLLEPVGGEEAYGEMVEWAGDNLADAEIDAFNSILEGGDLNAIKMAVENLNTKFKDANGVEPSVQLSGKGGESTLSVYESTADMMKDMNNPEYKSNAAFRAKVAEKLGRSNIM